MKDSTEERVTLPFGWFIGRRASAKAKAGVTPRASIKTSERALKGQETPLEKSAIEVAHGLGTVIRKDKRFTNALSGAPDNGKREPESQPTLPNPQNLAGRKSVENPNQFTGFSIWQTFSERKGNLLAGLSSDFDLDTLSSMSIDALADLLADLSPEVSKALWDFIILSNSGYELKAYRTGTEEIDARAQAEVDAMHAVLAEHHGSVGVFFDRLFKLIFLRGSYLMELVLAANAKDFADVATPDTATLEFRRTIDPIRGQVWDFGQRIQNEFVSLNIPTIRYIPLHPHADSIEGHAVCTSAFFLTIFLMSVLRDTKRVVEHQGYLRLDIKVLFEKLAGVIPEEIQNDPDRLTRWQEQVLAAVSELYSSLDPDDTYVHGDAIEVNNPVGAVSSDSLQAIDALFQALERMAVRALKTMPLLLGTNQSRTETQANREWEIYAKGIETIQHYVETGFEYVFSLALRAKGIQADVRLRFARFRAAEAMRDEQVDTIRAKRARYLYDCGYINQDEASVIATNGKKEKADQKEPRNLIVPTIGANPFEGENPNAGEGRSESKFRLGETFETVEEFERWLGSYLGERQPTAPEIDEAEQFLEEFAPEETQDMFDAEVASVEEQGEVEEK